MPIQFDIPNLDVLVTNDLETKRVVIRYPSTIVGHSPIPLDIGSVESASYAETASLALYSLFAEFAPTSSYANTAATVLLSGLPNGLISSSAQLDMGSFAITGSNTFTGDQIISGSIFFEGSDVVISPTEIKSSVILSKKFLEYNNIRNVSITGSVDFDASNHSLIYYTVASSGNWTLNFRGDNVTSLNDSMDIGQNITMAMMVVNSSPAYYAVNHLIDGVSVVPLWQGSAPTGGEENAMEVYSYSIVKTANATFTLIAAKVRFS